MCLSLPVKAGYVSSAALSLDASTNLSSCKSLTCPCLNVLAILCNTLHIIKQDVLHIESTETKP